MVATAAFKPTRAEVRRVQYLARETEIDAAATARLVSIGHGQWYGMHRPAQRAAEAFSLASTVAARAAGPFRDGDGAPIDWDAMHDEAVANGGPF